MPRGSPQVPRRSHRVTARGPLRATGDRAGDVQQSRTRGAPVEDEGAEVRQVLVELVAPGLQPVDVALRDAQRRPGQLRHVVLASDADAFNLGGDLELFGRLIRAGNREPLLAYARRCIEGVHAIHNSLGGDVRTIALVQGDALGGGLELALACQTIVAEEGVTMGLPEVLFGLFPGMGAYSLLSRRVSPKRAEEMMLNVFDEARDKIAEIIYRVDKDRAGRKFLAVKDQNTVKKYRAHRLMTLMHFFLLHRYKIDLVHYVTPTDDNRLSVSRMIQNGVFREARTDDPNIIAIGVDTARAQKIFANDDSLKRFITNEFRASRGQTLIRAVG